MLVGVSQEGRIRTHAMFFRARAGAIMLAGTATLIACGGDGGNPAGPGPPNPPPPTVNELPTARIAASVDEGAAPLPVTFDGRSSSDPDGTIASYSWTFGDGTSASGAEVSHTYTAAGLFQVQLTVIDDRGGSGSTKDSVFVSSPPGPGTNSIQGTAWWDRNLNGVPDGGEPALPRFVVFLDGDGDDVRDPGEPLTFTAVDGSYSFTGLDAGTVYTVSQALPFGWSNTTPGPGPVGARPVAPTATRPARSLSADAGLARAATAPALTAARVIGGSETPIETFPFQVALMFGNFQFCGGTLVNSEYVLTAAHCVDGLVPRDVDILIGTRDLGSGGERVGVEAFRPHPGFNNSLDNDVALLRLERRLLRPRVFVQTPDQLALSAPGTLGTVIGWGQLDDGSSPNTLRRADGLPVLTNEACANSAGIFFGNIGPRTLCAGLDRQGKGTCFGDSGGPLLVAVGDSWVEIGITSFIINRDQCGNVPGAYSRVSELYDYILSVARIEASGSYVVDWSSGPSAQADFGNFH